MTDPKLIDVRFDGTAWWIEDDALDKPLQFSRLVDAAIRARELSMATGREAHVHGWDGELIDTFVADGYVAAYELDEMELDDADVRPDDDEPAPYGFSYDASARFSLLELY